MLPPLIRAHYVLDSIMHFTYCTKPPPQLKRFRIAASYYVLVKVCNSITVEDGFDYQVDDMAGAPETVLAIDGGNLAAECGDHSIVVRCVVHCECSNLSHNPIS